MPERQDDRDENEVEIQPKEWVVEGAPDDPVSGDELPAEAEQLSSLNLGAIFAERFRGPMRDHLPSVMLPRRHRP
jgi:hypothetical protein